MDSLELHSAVRRYLLDRRKELMRAYAALPNSGRTATGYTDEALGMFPRYLVADAIRIEVERLDPDRLPARDALVEELLRAAREAGSIMTRLDGAIEVRAMADERRRCHEFVKASRGRSASKEVLPYRRVLTAEEGDTWRSRLADRWGVEDTTWYPIHSPSPPAGVLVLDAASSRAGGSDAVRRFLRASGATRVVELREDRVDYLIDVSLLEVEYDGVEALWADDTTDWVAFASHEATVSFGGTLAEALPREWPACRSFVWQGW